MKLLFTAEKILTPADSKTHMAFAFEVTANLAAVELRFSYAPKRCEDRGLSRRLILDGLKRYAPAAASGQTLRWQDYLPVQNLLTLSLDTPSGYAGCAHRHNPVQRHTVAPGKCSPGFAVTSLKPGLWHAVVSAHCVATPQCVFVLEAYGATEGET
ncbi:MAG TPA: hypothetical protein PL044_01445 [Clostridiales bacterium]|nr:MAG: hypothetical protein BWY37_00092 [Firmicutes bacterium ADurb.Bin262]HOU09996.1 hypothetical protein [Clostridiales bacterium]HQK72434.1 hypothetical protein [Clostridiales bacterium]